MDNLEEVKTTEAPVIDAEKLSTFEISDLIKSTCEKIAEWFNENPNRTGQSGLRQLSIELIDDIAGAAFSHLGLKHNSEIAMDDETKKKFVDERKKERGKEKPVEDMTDLEFKAYIEMQKRKRRNP